MIVKKAKVSTTLHITVWWFVLFKALIFYLDPVFIVLLVIELAATGPGEQQTVLYGYSVQLSEAGNPGVHHGLPWSLSVLEESFSLGSFIFVISSSARPLLLPLQGSQFLPEKCPSSAA